MLNISSDPIKPRGPAADPKYPISTSETNPYNFTPQLLKASKLPPKVTDKYVMFFGYEGDDPMVSLQQWFPAPFVASQNPYSDPKDDTQVEFPTTEHYMMYHKALLMGDGKIAREILTHAHPSVAKRLGREVKNFDQNVWKENADRVVEEANWFKFSQNEDLGRVLVGTEDRILVEASPDDRVWGIGFNTEEAEGKEAEWGDNKLGKALMKVRDRFNQSC